eukprot:2680665-Pleurochrysis_carterae.AAC.2
MYRLTGLEESSPKEDGRILVVGNRPVNVRMNVSGCSTTTQSAFVHQQRRKKAIPQNMRPSGRFAWVCVLSLVVWCVHGGQRNARFHRLMDKSGATSPM